MRFDSLTPPDVVIASLIEPLAGIDLSDGLFADVDNIPDAKSSTLALLSLDTETGCGSSDRLAVPLDVGTLTSVFVPELAELLGAIVSSSTLARAAGRVLYGRLVCAEISETELAIFTDLPLLSLDTETGCGSSDRLAVPLDVGTLTGVFVPELAELLGTIVSSSTLAKAAGRVLYGRLVCAEFSGTELEIFADLPLLSLDTETGCGSSDRLAVPLDVGTLTGVFVPELAELPGVIVSSSTLAKAAGSLLYGRLVCAEISGTELAIFADEDIGSGSSVAAACPCFSFATVDDADRASPELRPVSARFGISLGEVFCSLLWGATAIRGEPNSPLGKADCAS
jgi:hypothetical protein